MGLAFRVYLPFALTCVVAWSSGFIFNLFPVGRFMAYAVVVGTGFIGPVHVEALRRAGVHVKGIVGSTPEKGIFAAQALGLERGYQDLLAVLADPQVDAVHLTTPNKLHRDQVLACLSANKHVVCEKPLAMNSSQTKELVEAALATPHLVTAVNYNLRFYPLMLHARDLIASGALGAIYSIRGAYEQDWLLFNTDWNWRLIPEEGGELRAVGDIGTHWMDLVGFVTGLRVEQVFADLKTALPIRNKPKSAVATFQGKEHQAPQEFEAVPVRTEDLGTVLFRYGGGARGVMSVSQVFAGKKNRVSLEIAGEKASLSWDSERPNELWLGHRDKANELLVRDPSLLSHHARLYADYPGGHNEGFPDTFKQLYKAIYADVAKKQRSSDSLYASFADGCNELLMCEAIAASHASEQWCSVNTLDAS